MDIMVQVTPHSYFLMCSGYMCRKTLHLRCSYDKLFLINIRKNDLGDWLRTCTFFSGVCPVLPIFEMSYA